MVGQAGESGQAGQGGEGGTPTSPLCVSAALGITQVSTTAVNAHDHLPIAGASRTTLLDLINTGAPLTFTTPTDGNNPHTHTITFTAGQLTTLRNGGALGTNITSSMTNGHTHTYAFECQP
jgi:hypothetical protein